MVLTRNGPEMMFSLEVAERVPMMLRHLSVIWICLFVFGLLTISNYPHPDDTDTDIDDESTCYLEGASRKSVAER